MIRQSIAARADGIVLIGVDCGTVRQSLLAAKGAGMRIASVYSMDCNDPSVGAAPLFDAPLIMGGTPDFSQQDKKWSAARADAVIAQTRGRAKVIVFALDQVLTGKYIREGFEKQLATCSGCKVVDTVKLSLTDLGPPLQAKTESAIAQHPEANVIASVSDGHVLAGIGPGVIASGRANSLYVMGNEGQAPNVALIRSGRGQNAAVGLSSDWAAWGAIDSLNRVFDGLKPQDSGLGWQLIDKTHNLSAAGPWSPPLDFKANYVRLWGVR